MQNVSGEKISRNCEILPVYCCKIKPMMLGLGLGLRPQNVGLGLEGCGLGLGACGLDHILVIVKLLCTVAHVMAVK